MFPLERHLKMAHELLARFAQDAIAQRNASILGYLREACDIYIEKRSAQNMSYQSLAVGTMFGQIHRQRSRVPTRQQSPTSRGLSTQISSFDCGHTYNSDSISREIDTNMVAFQQDETGPDGPDMAYDLEIDATLDPYPTMTPRTLWFDSYDEHMPLFSTISSNDYFTSVNSYG